MTALTNTRANAFALIGSMYTTRLAGYLGIKFKPLLSLMLLRGFNGYLGTLITYVL